MNDEPTNEKVLEVIGQIFVSIVYDDNKLINFFLNSAVEDISTHSNVGRRTR